MLVASGLEVFCEMVVDWLASFCVEVLVVWLLRIGAESSSKMLVKIGSSQL